TALTACNDMTAAASCASRRSSHCTYVPRPGGTLCATTSKTPPTESPVRNTLSTSSFIRGSASGSAQLSNTLSLLQLAWISSQATSCSTFAFPTATTWLNTSIPSSPTSHFATA